MTFLPTTISKISTQNVYNAILALDATYTGNAEVVTVYSSITVNIAADVSSANAGISIEFSQDGTNWDMKVIDSYTAPGNFNKTFAVQAPYYRLVYINGTVQATLQQMKQIAFRESVCLTMRMGYIFNTREPHYRWSNEHIPVDPR